MKFPEKAEGLTPQVAEGLENFHHSPDGTPEVSRWRRGLAKPEKRGEQAPGVELKSVIDDFLTNCQLENKTAKTQLVYKYDLKRFEAFAGRQADVKSIDGLTVRKFLTDLGKTNKPVSQHQYYRVLRKFFAWCMDAGVYAGKNPTAGISIKVPRGLPKVPPQQDLQKLLQTSTSSDPWLSARNDAMIALCLDAGLRRKEVVERRIQDLHLESKDGKTISIWSAKGQVDDTAVISSASAIQTLKKWVAMRIAEGAQPEDFLFINRKTSKPLRPDSLTGLLLKATSIKNGYSKPFGPHSLRHASGTAVLTQSGNLELCRQHLRHSSLEMSLRYARLTKTQVAQQMRRISPMDKLMGRG